MQAYDRPAEYHWYDVAAECQQHVASVSRRGVLDIESVRAAWAGTASHTLRRSPSDRRSRREVEDWEWGKGILVP